jgi:hypothetical protein
MLEASDILFLGGATEVTGDATVALEPEFGGWGNDAMLIVFRMVFSGIAALAFPSDEADRTVGTDGVEEACCKVGRAEGRNGVEGERSFVGLCGTPASPKPLVASGRLFLGLLVGRGGRAVVGGSIAGRDKTGRDVVTAVDMAFDCG